MNKKIIISLSIIGIAVAVGIGATVAYFSDKEISLGNTFTAGTINLEVGDANITSNGPVNNTQAWEPKNLTEEKFFDLSDLKPGDNGGDTIKIKVGSNPAWVCAEINNIKSTEEGVTDPETKLSDTDVKGELDEELYITFFKDENCDGIKDENDTTLVPWKLFANVGRFALADSITGTEFKPGEVTCISKNWCFGNPTEGCDGSEVGNKSQSDKLVADIALEAIQTRHNGSFVCVDSCANIDCSQGGTIAGSTCYQGQCVGFGASAWRKMPTGACEFTGTLVGSGPYTDNTCTTLMPI